MNDEIKKKRDEFIKDCGLTLGTPNADIMSQAWGAAWALAHSNKEHPRNYVHIAMYKELEAKLAEKDVEIERQWIEITEKDMGLQQLSLKSINLQTTIKALAAVLEDCEKFWPYPQGEVISTICKTLTAHADVIRKARGES